MNKTAEKLTSLATVKKEKPLSAEEKAAQKELRKTDRRLEQSTKLPEETDPENEEMLKAGRKEGKDMIKEAKRAEKDTKLPEE